MSSEQAAPQHQTATDRPVFAFVLFGGPLSGALVRDVRLANELAARGYDVHIWWTIDRTEQVEIDARITQHWLFHGLRYFRIPPIGNWGRPMQDGLGRLTTRCFHYKNRTRLMQKRPWMLDHLMKGLTRLVCAGVEQDDRIIRRFAREMDEAGVTHVLPMLGLLCPWVEAACRRMPRPAKFLVTFQGYELYSVYARQAGLEAPLYERLRAMVDASDFPAIAVSDDYRQRVIDEIGVAPEKMVAIPPGVPTGASEWTRDGAQKWLQELWSGYRPDVPLVSFVGRQDNEKGIDLLLYAAAILRARGVDFQLAICGPTLFGSQYGRICRQIADNLRCPVYWKNYISEEMRGALFAASRCVVYPSIHREPFGMVAAEVMAHGTPVLVPAYGGVSNVVEANGACGGLRFNVWDSGNLADQLGRLLADDELWRRLADDGPRAAAYFSIPNLADRVSSHLQLVPRGRETTEGAAAAPP